MAGDAHQHRYITPPSQKSLPLGVVRVPYYYLDYYNYLILLSSI
jgi:hypothetical protein